MTMRWRNIREEDFIPIISVMNDWWGGRQMADKLPKLFFQHFQDTSLVVLDNDQIVAFLVGFVSQTRPDEAYIHFVGVHPEYRSRGLGKQMYEWFFAALQARGCKEVHAVTSPVNKGSVAFHTRMGFTIEPGDSEVDGVAVQTDFDGRGQSRVRFVHKLAVEQGLEQPFGEVALATTPDVPYYAVIFSSLRTPGDNGYAKMADEMGELAANQPGFLGIESARGEDGLGITVSYWDSEASIRAWRENGRHLVAQKFGRENWYDRFWTRVCRVERVYDFTRTRGTDG